MLLLSRSVIAKRTGAAAGLCRWRLGLCFSVFTEAVFADAVMVQTATAEYMFLMASTETPSHSLRETGRAHMTQSQSKSREHHNRTCG